MEFIRVDDEGSDDAKVVGFEGDRRLWGVRWGLRYVKHDTSLLSSQDIKTLLQAYIKDNMPSMAAPKQQTEVVVLLSSTIGIGGGYHANQAQITGLSIRRSFDLD
ncbi:hypothetical protein FRC06_011215 [Ceratobasidium sp. 370]|nr:hypothetical protein FRC06_011215 [Ceratobasidium sp. 370]